LRISEPQIQAEQKVACKQYAAEFVPAPGDVKCGFALSTKGLVPINGLRHPPTENATGWYIWCGEQLSSDSDFFAPLCTSHVYEDLPEIARLLALPPGYRFLQAGEHLDIWYDGSLLET
jgi:hypothetical protein